MIINFSMRLDLFLRYDFHPCQYFKLAGIIHGMLSDKYKQISARKNISFYSGCLQYFSGFQSKVEKSLTKNCECPPAVFFFYQFDLANTLPPLPLNQCTMQLSIEIGRSKIWKSKGPVLTQFCSKF